MKEYWDNLFRNRDKEFHYETYLKDDIQYLVKGKLLDVGAGDGRNSFFFAEEGFDVSCMDYSEEGLRKIRKKSQQKGTKIESYKLDIFNDDLSVIPSNFDSIVLIHFFPSVEAIRKLEKKLEKNGRLYCITFINDDLVINSSKFEIGISTGEVKELHNKFSIVKEVYREDPRGELYTFILEK